MQDVNSVMLHQTALLNPGTSVLIQERPLYSGNLHAETPGTTKSRFSLGKMF